MPTNEENDCDCLRCTLLRLVLKAINIDDELESVAPIPMTRAKAEFIKMLIDEQEPALRRASAKEAIRINDRVKGTAEELPADIADHFRGIGAGKPMSDMHPLEDIDPPINSRRGRR